MQTEHTVLLVSADAELLDGAAAALGGDPDYRLILCRSEQEAATRLDALQAHLVVCDADLIADEASNVLVGARISHPHVARVLVGAPDAAEKCAAIARRAASYLYVIKPVPTDLIRLLAKRALELSELSRRHRVLSRELKISMDDDIFAEHEEFSVKGGRSQFEKLVYVSAKMAELCVEAKQAAATELPVLIQGETGTGKELLARAIHFNSKRMNSPMHVQNCGGMSDDTLHSELFGHLRGAFTGAVADRLGLFRAADGGTVFLDEISEISPSFQVSLLRFLQEGEVKPLGSDRLYHADVRVIAASNRPLDKLVERGEFRRDLYYRLKGFELHIPALRERPEDVPALTEFFIEKYAGVVGRRVVGVTKDALAKLQAYDYPGNVRELETEIRRMVAVAEQGGYISARHLSLAFERVPLHKPEAMPFATSGASLKEMVESLEKQAVAASLQRHHWNQSRAADELGLSRVGLANKIRRYGLNDA
ncbi:two component, sigma54 specific, transcriptional regulator, Fis family [Tistlia consotensis]|uniref:Two component, sigma54 specific, transcriptional regulator, Fis family n=1 Tax=Tistlia consotensis USBA 355 TaxID=560819 RepID=A0A1Y6C130_9PROT|nr:sigma-54 dependent transcriptional regulator [Tistlia consotensis]SMF30892.1 two component, sigma54 specific, transcriptional regulator, Fis family [Tistlia consotensis USBA 355]SNS19594.1 two component, sigma54 specific, transcriptional regulator, Fis family [Tistlia consotensis]